MEIIREFRTKNFRVVMEALDEQDLDLSFDDTGEVAEKLDNGELIAFCAHAYVQGPNGETLAEDYLGDCIYESFQAFMDHRACGRQNREWEKEGREGRCGSYFTDMIRTVCNEAREELAKLQTVKVRRVA